jgi:hypothetical protein
MKYTMSKKELVKLALIQGAIGCRTTADRYRRAAVYRKGISPAYLLVSGLPELSYGAVAGGRAKRLIFDRPHRVCCVFEREMPYIIQRVTRLFS